MIDRDEVMQMGEDELRVAIARDVMGWKIERVEGKRCVAFLVDGDGNRKNTMLPDGETDDEIFQVLKVRHPELFPRFHHDLNVMHRAEERVIQNGDWCFYVAELEILSPDNNHNMSIVHASAIDRCRAMVLAVRGEGR